LRDIPPDGSKITLEHLGSVRLLTVPYGGGGALRYFIGLFILFWLGGWVVGFKHAASEILSGEGSQFLYFWLGGWTLGGFFALYFAYRVFRPSVSETLKLGIDYVDYDSGIPPFRLHFAFNNQKEMWRSIFPKRIRKIIKRDELKTMTLRETDSGNRLTIDVGVERVDIATAASEIEREWLHVYLSRSYS